MAPINPAPAEAAKNSASATAKVGHNPRIKNDTLRFKFNNLEDNQDETKMAKVYYDVGYLITRISERCCY